MEIALNRIDYSLVGPNSIQSMKILPNADERGQQKIAMGSHDGVVQIFNIKKGNLVHAFKSLPGRKITRLELGGVHDQIQDKVFVAAENEVRGYNKKGKLFLSFETTLTEPIQHMSVRGNDLMVASFHTFLHYADCVEKVNMTFSDKITDIKVLPTLPNTPLKTVIACEDRTLRLVQDKRQTVVAEIVGRPSCLELAPSGPNDVLYGAQDGSIGLVSFNFQPVVKWVLEGGGGGGINCMCHLDVTGDGAKELIVGKDDGCVEIYAYDEMQELPIKRATYSCTESIMSVQAGLVGSSEHVEIIAVTYTGWFFGLTTENKESLDLRHGDGPTNMSAEMQERLSLLRMEIDEIEQKVLRERERYKQVTQTKPDALTLVPNIEINDKFSLMPSEAVYMLSIEVQTPIDNVLIQSNTPLQILDVERNSAVVSHSLCNPQDGNQLLVTYRCQVNTTRLEVMVQTSEGKYGELRAYVTVSMLPKCCRMIIYPIKPLSLHQRSHDLALDRPYNTLTLIGAFSLAEVHSWLTLCLPEVPEKAPLTMEGVLTYKNTFLNTILHCVYAKGKAEFKSDNMSTISNLKDVLTKEATSKKIELDISCDVHSGSTSHILNLLHPLLERQKKVASEFGQLEALHELSQAGVALPQKYQAVLDREPQLQASMAKQPAHLKRLKDMVCELFVDMGKFKGGGARARVSQLSELLDNYKDVHTLIEFFERP